jgi:hypothetical protein
MESSYTERGLDMGFNLSWDKTFNVQISLQISEEVRLLAKYWWLEARSWSQSDE